MKGRWGLQAKVTATYVAVTAGAVLLTELVIFGAAALGPPTQLSPRQVQGLVQATTGVLAGKLGTTVGATGQLPSASLGLPGVQATPGQAQPDGAGGVVIPQVTRPDCDLAPASVAVVVDRDQTVLATSDPGCFPVGSHGSAQSEGGPKKVLASFVRWSLVGSGLAPLPPAGEVVAWASDPIVVTSSGSPAKNTQQAGVSAGKLAGMLYVQVPAAAPGAAGFTVAPAVAPGLAALAAAVPAGLAFGLLSTRRLTRRLKRLAAMSLEVADGGFERRVPVSGHDEMSLLEENFNRMAGQLEASLDARRQLAEANARHAERSRIAMELHDSISQELFSLSVLAGGLRRALPPESPVLPEVETMEQTAGDTMREMQSLLLALRPFVLDEGGLAGAIEGVCHAYTERLGVPVRAELEPADLPPALEHAVFRVTQEAVANAARHAGADLVTVRLYADGDAVVLEIADDGRGFAIGEHQAGLGLHTMRDRVAALGGRFTVDSARGAGTRVRARFPLDNR